MPLSRADIGAPADDPIDKVRLIRSRRVGATTYRRLIDEHGSAQAALAALPDVAAKAGAKGYAPASPDKARQELEAGAAAGAKPLFLGDADYPPLLADIPDAPPLLWALGDPAMAQALCVALVGARNASALGRRMTGHLAKGLGKAGAITVSGLARGIDAACHAASTETGTIAVLAGGIDRVYPSENTALYEQIATTGLILSEMPPGLQPQARHFPRRNRIISGLARGLVVVEGAAKSGSLITARNALDQGREVMAVPGHPFDARAAGCNMLIRDGAVLARSADDVIAALGLAPPSDRPAPSAPAPASDHPGKLDHKILSLLGPTPVSEDILVRDLDAAVPHVLAQLAELDLQGLIERHPGGMVSRKAG